MARALTVQNAEINTASITIRTLQVEGKQVTMGVFRQIPSEEIIVGADEPTLQGVGWGHVNYLLDDYHKYPDIYGPVIHLVWQKGNDLRRTILQQKKEARVYPCRREYGETQEAFEERKQNERLEYLRQVSWHEKRNALVAPLFDLPQLFIAV